MVLDGFGVGRDLGGMGRANRTHCCGRGWFRAFGWSTLFCREDADWYYYNIFFPAHVMSAMSVYEVLRHFRSIIRLSPFRFEDFCMALQSEEQSSLLSEVNKQSSTTYVIA